MSSSHTVLKGAEFSDVRRTSGPLNHVNCGPVQFRPTRRARPLNDATSSPVDLVASSCTARSHAAKDVEVY